MYSGYNYYDRETNSQGKEIGRIIGDFDFIDPRFVNWIKTQ